MLLMSDTDITISRDVSCCNQIGYDGAMGRASERSDSFLCGLESLFLSRRFFSARIAGDFDFHRSFFFQAYRYMATPRQITSAAAAAMTMSSSMVLISCAFCRAGNCGPERLARL